jgi:hypothetical protein
VATAFIRARFNWGGIDLTFAQSETPSYATTQIVTAGSSAVVGSGVGVRRATLTLDRQTARVGADPAAMHFDFMNTTGGAPDDTWTSADFTTLEALIETWFNLVSTYVPSGYKFTGISWHRVGTGIHKPNPAERLYLPATPNTGLGAAQNPPQAACSITFRTGVRKSWGRTYLPFGQALIAPAKISTTTVDGIANATSSLVTSAATADFQLVVVSAPLHSALVVEKIEVDDNVDVIRRRRWKQSTYRKIVP